MRILFILSLLILPLTACKTTAENEHGRISIEDGDRGDYRHCPPGHAKKGWC